MEKKVKEVGIKDLVERVAENSQVSKADAKDTITSTINAMKELIKENGRLSLKGFITLERVYKAEAMQMNNFTKEEKLVPEHYNAKAKVSKSFIKDLNN